MSNTTSISSGGITHTRMGSIIAMADALLCFPYTSPMGFGEALGKPSFYYVPERYRMEFAPSFACSESLIGKGDLMQKLVNTHN